MTKLRAGVVGVGHLGQHHARILAGIPGVELVGVADSRPEQARAVAERNNTTAFTDYRELVDRVDIVSVAVPTSLHLEVASPFLDRGIATLVEKPLATSLSEAERLVALAEARGSLLQVGHIERFNTALNSLEGLRLRPKYIASERLSTYTFRSTDIGAVLDIMIHDLDLVLSMVSAPVRSVAAVGVSVFGGHEDVANARVEFEDGCVADLTASRVSLHAVRKMRLWGAEGYASLDFATRQGTLVQPSERLRRGELELEGLDMTQAAAVKERLFGTILRVDRVQAPTGPDAPEPLALELNSFIQAVRDQSRPKVSGSDALRAMRLADQILRSIQVHQWEGTSAGPTGPHLAVGTGVEPGHAVPRRPHILANSDDSPGRSSAVGSVSGGPASLRLSQPRAIE
jgi:predicted dehydrogenase